LADPIGAIWDAILWASDQGVACLHTELSIVVNGRSRGAGRGGDLGRFDRSGAAFAGD
jgi:hypothetical protein